MPRGDGAGRGEGPAAHSPDTHQPFQDIVIGGARKAQGMASFAEVLSKQDAEDIHRDLIARASEDWCEEKRLH